MLYPSPSQIGTWNGWIEPILPAPTIPQIHQGLMEEIDRELQPLSIKSQTVIVAARHEGDAYWTVDILDAPPPRGKYDTWTECLVDFDQYHDSIKAIRQDTAEALAHDLMNQTFPGWQVPSYGKPEPDWEEDWH